MGVERLSKDQASAICEHLDSEAEELAARPLGPSRTPYPWVDATHVRCRRDRRVAPTAVATAIGCDEDGWRRVSRVVAPVFRLRSAGTAGGGLPPRHRDARVVPRGRREDPRGGRARRAGIPRLPGLALEAPACQQRAGEGERGDKAQVFPSVASPEGLAGAVMCDMDEGWQDARYFSKQRMDGPCDESRAAGTEEPPTPERLGEWRLVAERAIDASLELADEMEAA